MQRLDGHKRMKIHEYQAKQILAEYGVAVPRGEVANTLEEASTAARKLLPAAPRASSSRRRFTPEAAARAAASRWRARARRPNSMPGRSSA